MCRPSGVREGEKVWEEGKKEAELGGGGRSVVTFSEEEGEGRFMIVESDIGREIFRFIAFARNKRKISDSYKRGY